MMYIGECFYVKNQMTKFAKILVTVGISVIGLVIVGLVAMIPAFGKPIGCILLYTFYYAIKAVWRKDKNSVEKN